MHLPFNGNFAINQNFDDPCCRASYAQFGMKGHNGIDYNLPTGTPVVAVTNGTIYSSFEGGGYGNYIFLTDDSGNQFVYGHLQKFAVSSGRVSEGQVIAYSNNTGNSSGPHLHFGYRPKGYNANNGFLGYEDPAPLFKEEAMYPKEGDLNNIYAAKGWPGHKPNANDIAYWCNGTGNPRWGNDRDVWTDLVVNVANWQQQQDANKPDPGYTPVTDQLYKKGK